MRSAFRKNQEMAVLLSLLLVAAVVGMVGAWSTRDINIRGYLDCRQRQENLANLLEVYQQQNGTFPARLDALPEYSDLPTICPHSGLPYEWVCKGQEYTVTCPAASHQDVGIPAGFPLYSSITGPNWPLAVVR